MAKYNLYSHNKNIKEAHDEIWNYMIDGWEQKNSCYYLIEPKEDNIEFSKEYDDFEYDFIGFASLEFEWEIKKALLGIAIHPNFWGNGISSERAKILTKLSFQYDDIEIVEASVHNKNENSVKAVEKYISKLGGEYVGLLKNREYYEDLGVCDSHVYQITRENFKNRKD